MAKPSLMVTPSKNCLCVPLMPSSQASLHGPVTPDLRRGAASAMAEAIGAAVMDAASAAAPSVTLSMNARRSVRGDSAALSSCGLAGDTPLAAWLMSVSSWKCYPARTTRLNGMRGRRWTSLPRAATDHVGPDRTCQHRWDGICTLKRKGDSFGRAGPPGGAQKNWPGRGAPGQLLHLEPAARYRDPLPLRAPLRRRVVQADRRRLGDVEVGTGVEGEDRGVEPGRSGRRKRAQRGDDV